MPEPEEAITRTAYDTVADAYADTIVGTAPEQAVDLAMVDLFTSLLPAPRRVLDAGCGAGRMVPYLAARGCEVAGVDLSVRMVERARRDHPAHPFSVGSLTALDVPDGSFDGVFSWYSTVHNPDEDLDRMLSELVRVLVPGGLLLVAFQTGDGMRRVGKGFVAMGHDVVMNRYHRSPSLVGARLGALGLESVARLERGPMGREADPQAVLVARRPA